MRCIRKIWLTTEVWGSGGRMPIVAVAAILIIAVGQGSAPAHSDEAAISSRTTLDYFPRDRFYRVLGKEVLSAKGEDMGRVVDVLFNEKGEPRAAVIDFGGFLGVGTRKIAVDWSALRFDLGEKKNIIALDLGREQLKAAPEYRDSDKPIAVVTLPQVGPSQDSAGWGR